MPLSLVNIVTPVRLCGSKFKAPEHCIYSFESIFRCCMAHIHKFWGKLNLRLCKATINSDTIHTSLRLHQSLKFGDACSFIGSTRSKNVLVTHIFYVVGKNSFSQERIINVYLYLVGKGNYIISYLAKNWPK